MSVLGLGPSYQALLTGACGVWHAVRSPSALGPKNADSASQATGSTTST